MESGEILRAYREWQSLSQVELEQAQVAVEEAEKPVHRAEQNLARRNAPCQVNL